MRKFVVSFIAILVAGAAVTVATATPAPSQQFSAHLTGAQEVPPRDTPAQGHVIIKVAGEDGDELDFRLIVANIENVVAAHIHCGAPGANGPVGITLFSGGTAGSGPVQGVLAQGTKTAPDAGNTCGWTTIEQVITAMLGGNTYVNVHTNDGVAPTNTGPGDFPGGRDPGANSARTGRVSATHSGVRFCSGDPVARWSRREKKRYDCFGPLTGKNIRMSHFTALM